MHEVYEGLRSKLSMSLKELNKTGKLSGAALNELHMITDTIKNLDKIEMLEDGGYSQAGYSQGGDWQAMGSYGRGGSYAGGESYGEGGSYAGGGSYERGNSEAGRRGSTYVQGYYRGGRGGGRRGYSREGGNSYGGGGYSRDDGKEMMMEQLEEMMEQADGSSREAIRKCMDEIKRT